MLSNAKIETIPNIMQMLTAINKVLSHFFFEFLKNQGVSYETFLKISEISASCN